MTFVHYELAGRRHLGRIQDGAAVPFADINEISHRTPTDVLDAAPLVHSEAVALSDVTLLPVVSNPSKVICVGLNYRDHIVETKRDFPTYPVMFPKYASSLIGANSPIPVPKESTQVDYEGELAVVIGRGGRRIPESDALDYVLGYTVANDITMRDFQYKTHQWMQGKAWDASTPVGPAITRPSDIDLSACGIRTTVNDQVVQESDLSQLVFSVPNLVSTISVFTALEPGDIILTGTPGGVGFRRKPQLLLSPGDHVRVDIDGLGGVSNTLVAETVA